ncbi:MAG: CocE/NonD family hydrolase, partial [Pseudomonadota bacterium]
MGTRKWFQNIDTAAAASTLTKRERKRMETIGFDKVIKRQRKSLGHDLKEVALSASMAVAVLGMTACSADETSISGNAKTDVSESNVTSSGKVSAFGKYEGYSEERFDEFVYSSVYVPMSDGEKLAINIYRPARDGVAVDEKFPVILRYSRYPRAQKLEDGSISTYLGKFKKGQKLRKLLPIFHPEARFMRHGYVIAHAEVRGTNASTGVFTGEQSLQQAKDGYELVEWLADQDFSTGKVGMWGESYYGQSQLNVASQTPPSLKAIVPVVASFDGYEGYFSGSGILRKAVVSWIINNSMADTKIDTGAVDMPKIDGVVDGYNSTGAGWSIAPVDEDLDGSMLKAAVEQRKKGSKADPIQRLITGSPELIAVAARLSAATGVFNPSELLGILLNSSRLQSAVEGKPDLARQLAKLSVPRNISTDTEEFQTTLNGVKSSIPRYIMGGWRDGNLEGQVPIFTNSASAETKLMLGPVTHDKGLAWPPKIDPRELENLELQGIEALRWYDYWLKGIDNGVLDDDRVNYALVHEKHAREWEGAPADGWEWKSASTWPVPNTDQVEFYFSPTKSGSVRSVNDGSLTRDRPQGVVEQSFTVDYDVTTGQETRWYDTVAGNPVKYPDLVAHAKTALTYTTAPLEDDLSVVGSVVVTLQASSNEADGEFNVYLEEVSPDGHAEFIMERAMKASHRTLGTPPYDNLGLPWSISSKEAIAATPPL